MIPKSLKTWFTIHFLVDALIAIPLFIAPEFVLGHLQWGIVDPLTTRLVAAALFGIGGVSLLRNNASKDTYEALLLLKLIWSSFAILACIFALLVEFNTLVFLIACTFAIFFSIWLWYYNKLKK